MQTVISKWGNSLAFRIPSYIAKKSSLSEGDFAEIELKKDTLILHMKKQKLESLLSKVNKNNIHSEQDTGKVTGNEIW